MEGGANPSAIWCYKFDGNCASCDLVATPTQRVGTQWVAQSSPGPKGPGGTLTERAQERTQPLGGYNPCDPRSSICGGPTAIGGLPVRPEALLYHNYFLVVLCKYFSNDTDESLMVAVYAACAKLCLAI